MPSPLGSADGWDWWEADVVVRNPRHGYRWMLQHASGRVEWLNQSGLAHDRDPGCRGLRARRRIPRRRRGCSTR